MEDKGFKRYIVEEDPPSGKRTTVWAKTWRHAVRLYCEGLGIPQWEDVNLRVRHINSHVWHYVQSLGD